MDGLATFLGFKSREVFLNETRPMDSPVRDDNVWTTLYVVAFLNERLAMFEQEWKLLASKALRWVKKQVTLEKNVEELMVEIREIVRTK